MIVNLYKATRRIILFVALNNNNDFTKVTAKTHNSCSLSWTAKLKIYCNLEVLDVWSLTGYRVSGENHYFVGSDGAFQGVVHCCFFRSFTTLLFFQLRENVSDFQRRQRGIESESSLLQIVAFFCQFVLALSVLGDDFACFWSCVPLCF